MYGYSSELNPGITTAYKQQINAVGICWYYYGYNSGKNSGETGLCWSRGSLSSIITAKTVARTVVRQDLVAVEDLCPVLLWLQQW